MNQDILQLEKDPAIVAKYVKAAAFGHNRLVYIPVIIGVCCIVGIVLPLVMNVASEVGYPVLILLGAIAIICFVVASIMNKNAHKKLQQQVHTAPISIAKKIYGNDNAHTYYCIYTAGEHRQDEAFIDRIASKIFTLSPQPKNEAERKVKQLFRPDAIKPGEFAKQLPLEFTEGIPVWRRQFYFASYSKDIMQQIQDNDGKFYVATIAPENAKFVTEIYQ